MRGTQTHQTTAAASIRVTTTVNEADWPVTRVRVNGRVDVGTLDRWLIFWTAGREVRVGPLSRDQAEKLAEDLAYDAI
jgi:hypothetical protein